MKKSYVSFLLVLAAISVGHAQTTITPTTSPYGKIDKADLEMKVCDFEKDANAMVLFDKADVYYDNDFNVVVERHRRIKIFNDNGKKEANIRIEFYGGNRYEYVTDVQAETINLVDGKTEITKLDKKVLYTVNVDKSKQAYVFSFPNVKSGSVIEYKYRQNRNSYSRIPSWYFQDDIPVRYSELQTEIPDIFYFNQQTRITQDFVKNTTSQESKSIGSGPDAYQFNTERKLRALANIHSLPDEPYMSSSEDNLQRIYFTLASIRPVGGFVRSAPDSWAKLAGSVLDDEDFGGQFNRKLANEDVIIAKAKTFKTENEKLAYVFNEVRNTMKWNGEDDWYTNDGTSKAWDKKTGNSTEVNLILFHLLKQAGVSAHPMLVSTREHGKANPVFPLLYQFNRTVVYKKIDSTRYYVLDATGKYNIYSEVPDYLLNSAGFWVDKSTKEFDVLFLQREAAVRHMALISADIKPDGKVEGTAQLSSYSYDRIKSVKDYKTNGEQKYIDALRDNDNSLKISSIKFENMEVDSLPLSQNINFKLDLTGSDGTYIYFSPNLFTSLRNNPFLSENRFSDIDFGYKNYYSINGIYKMPAGYKAESLPKTMSIIMPDQSITFKRLVAEQDGSLVVRYVIDYKKTIFFKENYLDLREFYKKMNELLNEQIVLKKG